MRRAHVPLAALLLGCAALGMAVIAAPAGVQAAAATSSAATSSASAMPFAGPALDSEQLAITYASGVLQIYDVLQVANPQSQALQQIQLPLVAGAQNVQVQSGGQAAGAKVVGDALVLPLSLAPQGHTTIAISYSVPAPRLPAKFVRTIDFPTAQFAMVMRADQLALQTNSLAAMGVATVNGLAVRQYGAAAIPPDTLLAFTAEPAPGWLQQAASSFTPTIWLIIASVALGALLVVGLRRDGALAAGHAADASVSPPAGGRA